jgi:hypothetical protein
MDTSVAITDPLLRQTSGRRARLSDPHRTARVRIWSSGLRALASRHGSATSRHTVMNNAGRRILKQSLFSPSQPQRLLHPPELSLPRQPCCPGTRRIPCSALEARDGNLVIRAKLARLARKAGRVGGFIFVSRACRARLAYLVHDSRFTNDETGLREHPE